MVFHYGDAAANSPPIAVESLQCNLNFGTYYVSVAQAVAVKL